MSITTITPTSTVENTTVPAPTGFDATELCARVAAATDQMAAAVPDDVPAGVRRRIGKLRRQLAAASRLVARGSHLNEPACLLAVERYADRSAAVAARAEPAEIEMLIAGMGATLVALHIWRGHTACVPVTDQD